MDISTWPSWLWKFWLTALIITLPSLHLIRAVRRSASRDGTQDELEVVKERADEQDPHEIFDIIAVHGFGADARRTWSARRAGTRVYWLSDSEFLPKSFPEATVLTFNHCADYIYQAPVVSARESGIKLLERIRERRKTKKAPIILMGHSYGGLVIKEAVAESSLFKEEREAIVGLMFLGTPHFGSMWSLPAARILGWLGTLLATSTLLLQSMATEDLALKNLHDKFTSECEKDGNAIDLWRNSSGFREARPTMLFAGLFPLGLLVGPISASGGTAGVGIMNKDHSGLNKFSDRNDNDFRQICEAIEKLKRSKAAHRYHLQHQTSLIMAEAQLAMTSLDYHEATPPEMNPITDVFLESSEYDVFRQPHSPAGSREHILRIKSSRLESASVSLPHVFNALRRTSGKGLGPFKIFHCNCATAGQTRLRATSILMNLLARILTEDVEHVACAALKTRQRMLDCLKSGTLLHQEQYWSLLAELFSITREKPTIVLFSSIDATDIRDRREFAMGLMRLWLTVQKSGSLRILFSSLIFEDVETIFRNVDCFDVHREILEGMDILRRQAHNPQQGRVRPGLRSTGIWIQQHQLYQNFEASDCSGLLCIKGLGGCGKSTLLKGLIEEASSAEHRPSFEDTITPFSSARLHQELDRGHVEARHRRIVVSFFYHSAAADENEMSHCCMLISLLYQIFWQEPSLFKILKTVTEEREPKNWTLETFQAIFEGLRDYTGGYLDIHIFIDAMNESFLNETLGTKSSVTLEDILDLFENLSRSQNHCVSWKIMIATRELGFRHPCFRKKNTIWLHDENSDDVKAVVDHAVEQIKACLDRYMVNFPKNEIDLFADKLRTKAKGVILWIKVVRDLTLDRIKSCLLSVANLDKYLDDPSDDLDKLYSKIVDQLEERHKHDKALVEPTNVWLRWGAFASGSLRVSEFKDAVACIACREPAGLTFEKFKRTRIESSPDDQAMRTALAQSTGGFLELAATIPSSRASLKTGVKWEKWAEHHFLVQPLHATVPMFLSRDEARSFQTSMQQCHFFFALDGIAYLRTVFLGLNWALDKDAAVSHLDDCALLPHIFDNLATHMFWDGAEHDIERRAEHEIERLKESFQDLCSLVGAEQRPEPRHLLFQWCYHLAHGSPRREFWEKSALVLSTNSSDSIKYIKDLVLISIRKGCANTLRSLLAVIGSGDSLAGLGTHLVTQVFVHAKLSDDPRMSDVLQRLPPYRSREAGSVQDRDKTGVALDTAHEAHVELSLHDAISLGLAGDVISDLVAYGASVDERNHVHATPLHAAIRSGNSDVVKILLREGADPDARDEFGRTPLHEAVLRSDEIIMGTFLEARPDAELLDNDAQSALQCAQDHGQQLIIRQLVAHEAKLNKPLFKRVKGPWTVPIARSQPFVERLDLMSALDMVLTEASDQTKRVLIAGLGGSGKTQIAVEYARRKRDLDSLVSVFWIDVSSPCTLESSCRYLAQNVGIAHPVDINSLDDPPRTFFSWLSKRENTHWILILDNADDFFVLEPYVEQILEFKKGAVIITSRTAGFTNELRATLLEVHGVSDEEGRQMLLNGVQKTSTDIRAVQRLLVLLAHLPLALVQAAATMKTLGCHITDYIGLMESNRGRIFENDFEDRRDPLQLRNPITATWSAAFEQIRRRNSASVNLLSMISVLYPDNVPEPLLSKLGPKEIVETAIEDLVAFSFVMTGPEGSVSMHRLIQAATHKWLRHESRLESFQSRALRLVEKCFPPSADFEHWDLCSLLLPHANKVIQYETSEESGDLLRRMALYYLEMGQIERAELLLLKADETLRSCESMDDTMLALMRHDFALLYFCQGRLDLAKQTELQALSLMEASPTTDVKYTVASLVRLASFFLEMGDSDCAESYIREAILLAGEDELDMSNARSTEALILKSQGSLQEAEQKLHLILAARRRELGDHPLTLAAENNLAIVHSQLESDVEIEAFEKVLGIRKATRGRQSLSTVTSMAHLAEKLRSSGEWEQAENLDREALAYLEERLGWSNSLTLLLAAKSAVTLRDRSIQVHEQTRKVTVQSMEKLKEAETVADEVLKAEQEMLGQDHPNTLTSMEGLAELAERWMTEIVVTRSRMLGELHPDTLQSLAGLADILATSDRARLREAVEIEKSVALKYKRMLGPQHPAILNLKQRVSIGRNILHESESAEAMYHGDQSTESRSSYGDGNMDGSAAMHQSNLYEGTFVKKLKQNVMGPTQNNQCRSEVYPLSKKRQRSYTKSSKPFIADIGLTMTYYYAHTVGPSGYYWKRFSQSLTIARQLIALQILASKTSDVSEVYLPKPSTLLNDVAIY